MMKSVRPQFKIENKELDSLIDNIFEIIPSYYDDREAFQISQLIIKFIKTNTLL